MRKFNYIFILGTIAMIAFSCGGNESDGLDAKRAKLDELRKQSIALDVEISKLSNEIKTLDPDFEKKAAVLVKTREIKPEVFEHKVELRGAIASKSNVLLSAEMMGRVEKIHVSEGQKITSGQQLISIDASVVENNIKQIKAQLDLAVEVYDRQKRLWDMNIGTEVNYLQAKATKETLEAQLATLNSQLSMSKVKAPFSGVVDNIPARLGEVAAPGQPLIRIVNPDQLYIAADVSESFLGKFEKGQQVEVFFPALNQRLLSTVKSVGQTIKAQNRTFEMEINLPKLNFPAQPNQVVVLNLVDYQNDSAITVPTQIIEGDSDGNYVFIVSTTNDAKKVSKRHLKTGLSYQQKTEVSEGLKPGETIVINGHRDLTDGLEVSVVK